MFISSRTTPSASSRATQRLLSPTSVALGAALMYYADPDRGRRRRALLRDQVVHATRKLREARGVVTRDFAGRAVGLWTEITRPMRARSMSSDEALHERVRAKLGRIVSHPHAVQVGVQEGNVELSGPILTAEVQPLLRAVRGVPGVRNIENRLEQHDESGNISSLQGGVPRPGDRFELLQDNWSPTARVLTGGLGVGLAAYGASTRTPFAYALAAAGGALLLRAATNRDLQSLAGVGENCRGIDIEKTIRIDAPAEQVYAFWTDVQNFPRFMSRVQDVRRLDERRSHWVVTGPAGTPVEWTAEITREVPGALIEWCADDRSTVRHSGVVRFSPDPTGGTRVHVRLSYVPPAGALGHVVATLFGANPKHDMDADLLRMKSMIETGRVPHDAARRESHAPALAAVDRLARAAT